MRYRRSAWAAEVAFSDEMPLAVGRSFATYSNRGVAFQPYRMFRTAKLWGMAVPDLTSVIAVLQLRKRVLLRAAYRSPISAVMALFAISRHFALQDFAGPRFLRIVL